MDLTVLFGFGCVVAGGLLIISILKPRVIHNFNHNFHYQVGTRPNDIAEAIVTAARHDK